MHNEWRNDYRIYGCAMQLDIIEGQVWLQHNSTEVYIDRKLIKRATHLSWDMSASQETGARS